MIAIIIKRLSTLLGLATLAFCFCNIASASADPALWKLQDKDSTIYLFGTIHVMRPGVKWDNAAIDDAFAKSTQLWVEESDDADQAAMVQLLRRYAFTPTQSLSAKLTQEQRAELANSIRAYGLNPIQVDQERPWFAAVQLGAAQMTKAGYDPTQGIDRVLRESAQRSGKQIRAFETSEQQIKIFADLPPADELATLTGTLKDIDKGPAFIDSLITAWLAGNTDAVDESVSGDMRQDSPSLYQAVFLRRNLAWAKDIERLMAGKGTIFIAVGAGHLVGKDSVIALLQSDGYQITRQ